MPRRLGAVGDEEKREQARKAIHRIEDASRQETLRGGPGRIMTFTRIAARFPTREAAEDALAWATRYAVKVPLAIALNDRAG